MSKRVKRELEELKYFHYMPKEAREKLRKLNELEDLLLEIELLKAKREYYIKPLFYILMFPLSILIIYLCVLVAKP